MRIKSYFAESIHQAMEKARLELGPEAMLVSSRKVDRELKHLGTYEVVFQLTPEHQASIPPAVRGSSPSRPSLVPALAAAPAHSPAAPAQPHQLASELADLRRQIENVSRSVSRQNYQLRYTGANASPELSELHAQLLAADFSDEMAQDLVAGVQVRLENQTGNGTLRRGRDSSRFDALWATLSEEIEGRLTIQPSLGKPGDEKRIVVLVGPPGSGKTSTLVKLAVQQGIAARVPVQILSTDTLRLGGAEQLAAYARVLGAGFRAVHSTAALGQAIEEYKTKKLFLIDTPGFDATHTEESATVLNFLRRTPQAEVQLVLPASLRATSIARLLERFAPFEPAKLLLTRLDEAETAGALLEPALRSGLPVSFLGTGQQVPEDLSPASKAKLTEGLTVAQAAQVTAA